MKKHVMVTLSAELWNEAKQLKICISKVCERAIEEEIIKEK